MLKAGHCNVLLMKMVRTALTYRKVAGEADVDVPSTVSSLFSLLAVYLKRSRGLSEVTLTSEA